MQISDYVEDREMEMVSWDFCHAIDLQDYNNAFHGIPPLQIDVASI